MSVDINTEKLIEKCLQELRINQVKNKIYKDFYENNVDAIMSDYSMQDAQSNRKVSINFVRKFIDSETGYSLSAPVTYISKNNDKSVVDLIEYNTGTWSKAQDQKLRKESSIYGVAYELLFVNSDGEFNSMTLNPLNSYALQDKNDNVIMGLHWFKKKFDDKEYLDVYIDNRILHYECGGGLIPIGEDTHIFNRVPFIVYKVNDEMQSSVHDIISLSQGYNDICSDEINLINDLRNAYLVVSGADLEEEDLEKMKQKTIINIGENGKVEWLIKNIQDGFINNALLNLENKIYDVLNETNLNKDFTSNTSGTVLKTKLTNLENKLGKIEALFEISLRERLKFLSYYLQIETGQGFDVKMIKIQFSRNLPSDLTSLAQATTQLSSIVSQKSLLSLLPFINNVNTEMAQFKKEKSDSMINFDNVPDGGEVVNE